MLGNMEIVSCKYSRYGTQSDLEKVEVQPADAILQGAFVNTTNNLLSYNPFKDGGGIQSYMTPLNLESLFKAAGARNIETKCLPSKEYIANLNYDSNFVVGLTYINLITYHYLQILTPSSTYWSYGEDSLGSITNLILGIMIVPLK